MSLFPRIILISTATIIVIVVVVALVLSSLPARYCDDSVPVDFLLTGRSIIILSTVDSVLK